MKITWKPEKNEKLKGTGRFCFDDVIEALNGGGFRDVLENPNYPGQKVMVILIDDYAHAVPLKEIDGFFFLFTVYPSRALQKKDGE